MQKPIKKPADGAGKISKRSGSTKVDQRFNQKLAAEIREFNRLVRAGMAVYYIGSYPAIGEVVDAALADAKRRRRYREEMYFTFRGRRYSYSVTNLGRVVVRDSSGELVGVSRFFARRGD